VEDAEKPDEPDEPAALHVALGLHLLSTTRNGQYPDGPLKLAPLLQELDAWLADDRQWRSAQPQHWRALLDDVASELAGLEALGRPPFQDNLRRLREELLRHRQRFNQKSGEPDAAFRRQLVRVSRRVRAVVSNDEVLDAAWERLLQWAETDVRKAELGVRAVRDLAELQGHDADALFDRAGRVLHDQGTAIAYLSGAEPPDDRQALGGKTADERLQLVQSLFYREPDRAAGIVWLMFRDATLFAPWMLELGQHAVLYQGDFLLSLLDHAPDDPRLPDDLRGPTHPHIDRSWFDQPSAAPADGAPIDMYVFLRLNLPSAPRRQLLAESREIAEFLPALGGLAAGNHDLWTLGDSHLVRGWQASTAYEPVNPDLARTRCPVDGTALHLSRNAEALGAHIPFPDQLRTAGRLLVWLRQASGSDNPAQVVLCDRVIEQIGGWAGVSQPHRFVSEFIRPAWIYGRIRSQILNAYLRLREAPQATGSMPEGIVMEELPPPHSPRSYRPSINLRRVVESLDELIAIADPRWGTAEALDQLRSRLANKTAVAGWLDELGTEFDRRNAALRRNRNALMHGGPLVRPAVDHVSQFALALAYHAITPAIELMLADKDLVDGFLDQQQHLVSAEALLREGKSAGEALFWNDEP
jgi:hypothetical protein